MTRSEWKHGETRRLVERHYGTLQAEKAIRASHSVHWKLNIAAYHASEIKKMSKVVAPSQMEAVRKIFLHASGNKQAVGYVRVQFRMEAHLIACTQALHSIGDIISHVIWYGTGLGSTVPDKNKISLVGVINALETQEKAVGAMKALKCLRNSEAFTYLTAYVNTTKHRSLLDSRASASMNLSQPRHGFS